FRLASLVHQRSGGHGDVGLHIGNYQAQVNIHDGRFVSVIAELSDGKAKTLLSQFLKLGDTLLDEGANQGAFSIVGSHLVGASGTVKPSSRSPHWRPPWNARWPSPLRARGRC
ncbi:MAG TPA: hypothetical protein VGW38_23050, partial [Chloroflexota bacterium]|nr:hypothetical protein [Chloroflexota bacterium]